MDNKVMIAKRVAQELQDGYIVNLGIGIPTMVADYVPDGLSVTFQSENGIMGLGTAAVEGSEDMDIVNAGGGYVTNVAGAQFVSSADSFGVIRGGHVDIAVLGALQVDAAGNLANWCIPGKWTPGMGGAMDLVVGAKSVILAMEHTQKGKPKILKECTFPLTGVEVVNMIVTELGVMKIENKKLILTEVAPGVTVDDVKAATDAEFTVSPDLKVMDIAE